MTQTTLLIALFILEVVAFGWLIWEAKLGREKREQRAEPRGAGRGEGTPQRDGFFVRRGRGGRRDCQRLE